MAAHHTRLILATIIACSTTTVVLADQPATEIDAPASKAKKKIPIAKSHGELARLLTAALDKKDYKSVTSLMLPPELYNELGAPEEHQKRYAKQVERTPALARMLHAHLAHRKLTPLKGKSFQKHDSKTARKMELGGKTLEQSTGIRLLDKDGKVLYEVADMATAIDGRWYVMQLLDPRTEALIKKDIPDVIENSRKTAD